MTEHFRKIPDWRWVLLVATLLSSVFYVFSTGTPPPPPRELSPYRRPGHLIPESERTGHRRIIGLDAHRTNYIMLPSITGPAGADTETYRDIDRQLYWLNFRLSHGRILPNLPNDCELYLAVPDAKVVSESLGSEQEFFEEYLRKRNGWTNAAIRERIRFFPTAYPLIWTQDAGEMMIRPEDRVATIVYGSADDHRYLDFLTSLTTTYPKAFKIKALPREVSGEGGDLEVVWGPDHYPALLVGRHRILRYMDETRGKWDRLQPLTRPEIEEARAAFSQAYEGLPIHIVPEQALLKPSEGSDELFHLDMVASIMDSHKNERPDAFIPEFMTGDVLDAVTGKPLDEAFVAKCRWEYDQAARQLKDLGYDVIRLPFNDHPVRAPVNFGKVRDEVTGRYVVQLAKFPFHLPAGSSDTPQARLLAAIHALGESGRAWQESGTTDALEDFKTKLANIWTVLDESTEAPNPIYEENARRIRDAGYEVIEVPSYPWGSGGIHCQILK